MAQEEQAVRDFYEAYDFKLRNEGYHVSISEREQVAINNIRPLLESRAPTAIQPIVDSVEQIQKLQLIAQELESEAALSETEKLFCTTATFRRYLRARDWDVEKALKLLLNTLKWRRENISKYQACDYCIKTIQSHAVKTIGFSKTNCPIVYTDFKHATGRDAVAGTHHLIVTMEKVVTLMEALGACCNHQLVIIIHFEGFGFSDMDPRVGSNAVGILGDYYPERLYRAVLVDAPFIFEPLWKMLKSLLPKETAAKVVFVRTGGNLEQLDELFDINTKNILLEQIQKDKL